MFSFIMKFLFIQFTNGRRRGIWLILSEIFSLTLTIYIFWMTNKLVDKDLVENEASSYFHFLLIGELALILPVSLLENTIRNFLEFYQSQFIATLEGNQIPAFKLILLKSFTELSFPALRVAMMFLFSAIIFHVQFSFPAVFQFMLVQVMGVAAMAAMACLTTYIYLSYQRGLKLVYTLNSLLVVLGGAYFPVSFFPSFIREYFIWLFPQSIVLQLSRMAFHQKNGSFYIYAAYFLLYIAVTTFMVKKLTGILGIRRQKKMLSYVTFS